MRVHLSKIVFGLILAVLLPCFFAFRVHTAEPNRSYLTQQISNEDQFLAAIRTALVNKKLDAKRLQEIFIKTNLPQEFHGFALVLYQPGKPRLVVIRTGRDAWGDIKDTIKRVLVHPRFNDFSISNPSQCRIQIDFLLDQPKPFLWEKVADQAVDASRFEPGVDGVLAKAAAKQVYFLPGDAFVRSLLSKEDVKKYINKQFKSIAQSDIQYLRFRSESYISYEDKLIKLLRGYPVLGKINKEDLLAMGGNGVNYVVKHQRPNGSFLYYYDAAKDSFKDHEHPKRPKDDLYYNILRHIGGVLLILFDYDISPDPKLLPAVHGGIKFLLDKMPEYQLPDGKKAAYVFDERKAKLGGSGLALYMFSYYQHLTGDHRYEPQARALANHLLTQILETGEFIYYYSYLDELVKPENNHRYFNFYYPGEAMIGLATYYKFVATDAAEKEILLSKMKKAFDFLIHQRPKIYGKHYTSLPSDSWLMTAINEAWDIPQLQDKAYRDFVFNDADTMVRLMYKPKDAIHPDYVGSFYYKYGDIPYPDGARCEGLLGAYHLALKVKDEERITLYQDAVWMAAWAVAHLVNTPQSTYAVPNPDLTVGGIRFKMTRQWFRVDTIQHVAAFYLKFIKGKDK